jgi:hypothetical protein
MGTSRPNVHFHHLIEREIVKSTAQGEVLAGSCSFSKSAGYIAATSVRASSAAGAPVAPR